MQLYEWKNHKTQFSASSVHKCRKTCSKLFFNVLRLITTVWAKMSENSYHQEFCAQVSQIVLLADLTTSRLITAVKTKRSRKLISPRVLCTNVTNRVLSWFDRFTACYYSMSKNVTKLITPRVLYTSITNRVVSWFDRFTAYYNCMSENVTNSYLREFCAQISQNVLLADFTDLRLITSV